MLKKPVWEGEEPRATLPGIRAFPKSRSQGKLGVPRMFRVNSKSRAHCGVRAGFRVKTGHPKVKALLGYELRVVGHVLPDLFFLHGLWKHVLSMAPS